VTDDHSRVATQPSLESMRTPVPGPIGHLFAYSAAVRVGNQVWVSGAAPYDRDGRLVGADDPYQQARQAIANLAEALHSVGADLGDVVATRIYVVDIDAWRAVGRAHGEAFRTILPAATLVEVRRLLGPGMQVEIEAEAILRADAPPRVGAATDDQCPGSLIR
jgi:enamine deaminase RidA (YjgF/YER057c/UK114 family)